MSFQVFEINGLSFSFLFAPERPVSFLDVTSAPLSEGDAAVEKLLKWARLVEVQASGFDHDDHHGKKYTGTSPGGALRYVSHRHSVTEVGPKLEIVQDGGGLRATSHIQFMGDLPAFRSWTVLENVGAESVMIEYVSTFALAGLSRGTEQTWSESMRLHFPDNTWGAECQWRSGRLQDFGFHQIYEKGNGFGFSVNRIAVSNMGTWSTLGHLPIGALENIAAGYTMFWQIEHNGSWHWEISDIAHELYLQISGPTYREGHWSKNLTPGQSFQSVSATFGRTQGDITDAIRVLTQVRRMIRRPHRDTEALPVIFNDYMNCLMGEPTSERLWPVIDRAAEIGSEYFVIDAGWYADINKDWWATVGEWQESASRFPEGLAKVTSYIRERGMIPGLWLEIEVIGVQCSLAQSCPDDWFFQRAGRRLIDHGRYQLDFRNPAVREHATGIVDRLVRDYGIGYIKMDYNINAGPGTDVEADSPGEGLIQHNRAYIQWVESILDRHEGLVIENCSSGGLRMDYANLALKSIQSTSDQMDYRLTAIIAAASASAVTPEQAAVWTYPLKDSSEEATVFNMINALLFRVHQSGRIHETTERNVALVKSGIAVYKDLRKHIPQGLPFWPLGIPRFGDSWASYGFRHDDVYYVAVWRLNGDKDIVQLPLPGGCGVVADVDLIYPTDIATEWKYSADVHALQVVLLQPFMARLFRVVSR